MGRKQRERALQSFSGASSRRVKEVSSDPLLSFAGGRRGEQAGWGSTAPVYTYQASAAMARPL